MAYNCYMLFQGRITDHDVVPGIMTVLSLSDDTKKIILNIGTIAHDERCDMTWLVISTKNDVLTEYLVVNTFMKKNVDIYVFPSVWSDQWSILS
jgi:hypothetical protein